MAGRHVEHKTRLDPWGAVVGHPFWTGGVATAVIVATLLAVPLETGDHRTVPTPPPAVPTGAPTVVRPVPDVAGFTGTPTPNAGVSPVPGNLPAPAGSTTPEQPGGAGAAPTRHAPATNPAPVPAPAPVTAPAPAPSPAPQPGLPVPPAPPPTVPVPAVPVPALPKPHALGLHGASALPVA